MKHRRKPSNLHKCFLIACRGAYKALQSTLVLIIVLACFLALLGKIELKKGFQRIEGYNACQMDILNTIEAQDNKRYDLLIISPAVGRHNDYSIVYPAENWRG